MYPWNVDKDVSIYLLSFNFALFSAYACIVDYVWDDSFDAVKIILSNLIDYISGMESRYVIDSKKFPLPSKSVAIPDPFSIELIGSRLPFR